MCVTFPCCYCSARSLTIFIAYFQIVVMSIVILSLSFISGVLYRGDPNLMREITRNNVHPEVALFLSLENSQKTAVIIWLMLLCAATLILGIILLQGAKQMNRTKLTIWLAINLIGIIAYIPIAIYIRIIYSSTNRFASILSFAIQCLVTGFSLWVVESFRLELENEEDNRDIETDSRSDTHSL